MTNLEQTLAGDSDVEARQFVGRERTAWAMLAIVLLFSIAAPLNQFKVPPIMPLLMGAFNLPVGQAGLLMSVYAFTGVILALPSGLIFQKAGYRITGLLAGVTIVLGSGLGAISHGLGMLLASRVIEGAGTSFMAVLAPAIIAQWFRARRRGTAMGIWSAWVPLGSTVMFVAAPALAQSGSQVAPLGSWRAVWWVGAVYGAAVTLLYVAAVRPAPGAPGEPAQAGAARVSTGEVLRNRNIWLLAVAFGCFNLMFGALATYLPTFLNIVRGLTLARAALLAGITTFVTIFSCPAGGLVSDRLGSRRRLIALGLILAGVLLALCGAAKGAWYILVALLAGLFMGLVPTNIFASAVEAAGDGRRSGLAMAMIAAGQNAGLLLGPVVFGSLIESTGGWPAAFVSLAIVAMLGAAAGWLARTR